MEKFISRWFKSRGIREEVVLEFIKDSNDKRFVTILSVANDCAENLPSHSIEAKASRIEK